MAIEVQSSNGGDIAKRIDASIDAQGVVDLETASPPAISSTDAASAGAVAKLAKHSRSPWLASATFVTRRGLKVAGAVFIAVIFAVALLGWPMGLIDSDAARPNLMAALFLTGLVLVILEDHVGVNKSAVMLMVSASMWTFLAVSYHPQESKEAHEELQHELDHGLQDVGAIILFLLPAMGVVESIDHFDGFAVVTSVIAKAAKGRKEPLIPILSILCFFMSAVIDNLTATIVCLKLLRHAVGSDRHLRHSIGGLIVVAANAGGAWSPVGDVTTTMLWLADKITVTNTVLWLFLPSFSVIALPLVALIWQARREARAADTAAEATCPESEVDSDEESTLPQVTRGKVAVLLMGVVCILMVPVLKMCTGLPPYLGMLLALGVIWFVTDTLWFQRFARSVPPRSSTTSSLEDETQTPKTPAWAMVQEPTQSGSVVEVLHSLDLTGLLFFAGVLLAVGALDTAGVLKSYAEWLVELCGNSPVLICSLLGVSSAVVDNVPLVQAAINMFPSTPADDPLWQLVALAAGTGGSILSIGSISGVTLMTMEGVGYLWYCRKVSLWAALGFALGIAVYQAERFLFA